MKFDMDFKGDLILEETFKRGSREIRSQAWKVLKNTAEKGKAKAKQYAPVDTMFLKENITTDLSNWPGMTTKIHSQASYSGYQEFGTRFMDAQPFMRPALKDISPQFKKDMTDVMKGAFE